MAKKTNIFAAGNISTAALPLPMFDRLLATDGVKPSTVLLYVYLVRRATGPTFRLHMGTILAETGFSRPTYREAREQLRTLNLIRCWELPGTQGWWEFELLTNHGTTLPTYEDYVHFSDLPADEIEAYYADRLGVSEASGQDADGSLLFDCPFGHTGKKPTLKVTIDGGDHHGRFICNNRRCGRHGGMIGFEQMIARQAGRDLSNTQAGQAVRGFFVGRRRPVDERLSDGPTHPIVAELTEPDDAETEAEVF